MVRKFLWIVLLPLLLAGCSVAGDEANSALVQGVTLLSSGDSPAALEKFHEALELYTALEGHDRITGESAAMGNIGITYLSMGRYGQSLEYLGLALDLLESGDDDEEEPDIQLWLFSVGFNSTTGLVYDAIGDYDTALHYHQLAAETLEALKTSRIYERLSPFETARYADAVRALEHNVLLNIAAVYRDMGEYEPALEYLFQALLVAEDSGDRTLMNRAHTGLGLTYVEMGSPEEAALHLAEEEHPLALGRLSLLREEYRAAAAYFAQALEEAQTGQIPDLIFASRSGLGLAYEGLGEFDEARDHFQSAVQLSEQIESSIPPALQGFFPASKTYGFSVAGTYAGLERVNEALP